METLSTEDTAKIQRDLVKKLQNLIHVDDETFFMIKASASGLLLTILACHKDLNVRCQVAQNPNTPPSVLEKLAQDKITAVRRYVASNPNTSPDTLAKLAGDPEYIRKEVLFNPSTPGETLKYLVENNSSDFGYHLAGDPNTLPDMLRFF